MSLRVLQVVASMKPIAGSVAIVLPGLIDALQSHDVQSELMVLESREEKTNTELIRSVSSSHLVHIHGWGGRAFREVARAANHSQKPFVIAPHGALTPQQSHRGGWRRRALSALADRRIVRRAQAVLAVNSFEEERLRHRRPAMNIRRLPYGLNFEDYTDESSTKPSTESTLPGNRTILLLAPLRSEEGVVPLLVSLMELGPLADGWNVVIAGPHPGDSLGALDAAIRRKGAENRVRFVEPEDIGAQGSLLLGASLLVAPRTEIGVGVSVLQAAEAGVPVIASRMVTPPGLEGAVQVYGTARHELKKALRKFFELDDAERRAQGTTLRDAARKQVDWSIVVKDYVQAYRDWT